MIEGIVSHVGVMMAPGQLPGIGSEHAGGEAAVVRSLEHGQSDLIVWALIQLKEPTAVLIRFADSFNAVASGGRQAVWEIQLMRHSRNRELASRMVDSIDSNWSESNGSRYPVAENFGSGVSGRCVDKGSRYDLVAVERHAIGTMRPAYPGIAT